MPIDSVPGKPACSPLAVTVERGRDHDAGPAGGEAGGQRLGDDGVGAERQVRSVLLARADRHARAAAGASATSGHVCSLEPHPGDGNGSGTWAGRGPGGVVGLGGDRSPLGRLDPLVADDLEDHA